MKDAWLMHQCKMNLNLDHLYCHTNDSAYIRSSSNTTTTTSASSTNSNSDIAIVRKEVKQLKTMLLLHLDLIQQQSDQLMAKDKQLSNLRQENEILKLKVERLDRRAKIINNSKQQENYVETNDSSDVDCAASSIVGIVDNTNRPNSDIFKKISTKLLNNIKLDTLHQIVEPVDVHKNGNFVDENDGGGSGDKIMSTDQIKKDAVNLNGNSEMKIVDEEGSTVSNNDCSADDEETINTKSAVNNIIGESNGKYIHKIMLQRIPAGDKLDEPKIILKDCTGTNDDQYKSIEIEAIDENSSISPLDDHDGNQNKIETNSKPLLLSAVDNKPQDIRQLPINQSPIDIVADLTNVLLGHGINDSNEQQQQCHQHPTQKRCLGSDESEYHQYTLGSIKRCYSRSRYMTTKRSYRTREWKMDQLETELNRQIIDKTEMNATDLQSDRINLEIPKWCVRESSSLYCIEGTENLGDEVFHKRHARLEHHEKKRKKWDVQRIREQRTIERLKRRHYKDDPIDVQSMESEPMTSFYPTAENIKFVQITDDLPIQAFGESIPAIHRCDFTLPWHTHHRQLGLCATETTTTITTTPAKNLQFLVDGGGKTSSSILTTATSGTGTSNSSITSIVFAIKKRIHRKSNSTTTNNITAASTALSSSSASPLRGRVTYRRNRCRR